jgi:hypothetical protein
LRLRARTGRQLYWLSKPIADWLNNWLNRTLENIFRQMEAILSAACNSQKVHFLNISTDSLVERCSTHTTHRVFCFSKLHRACEFRRMASCINFQQMIVFNVEPAYGRRACKGTYGIERWQAREQAYMLTGLRQRAARSYQQELAGVPRQIYASFTQFVNLWFAPLNLKENCAPHWGIRVW